MLVYFENENLLLPIQVKLSNKTPWDERRKQQWANEKLFTDAAHQVNKDIQLLRNEAGLKFAASELGLKKKIPVEGLAIYPLIVTDNFFADHKDIPYNNERESALVVSYFELESLIHNRKVHEKQDNWEPIISGEQLAVLLEENVFWNFIKQLVPDYHQDKSLKTINAVDRINFKI